MERRERYSDLHDTNVPHIAKAPSGTRLFLFIVWMTYWIPFDPIFSPETQPRSLPRSYADQYGVHHGTASFVVDRRCPPYQRLDNARQLRGTCSWEHESISICKPGGDVEYIAAARSSEEIESAVP